MHRTGGYWAEQQTAELRQQIQAAEAELIEREIELLDLDAQLAAFQSRYEARVGRTLEEIKEVDEHIQRCRRRLDQQHQWGSKGPPQRNYVPVEEQYRRIWQQSSKPRPVKGGAPVDPATRAQIQRLYRQLCRRFHPALSQHPRERLQREQTMKAVSAAYVAGNLAQLQALAAHPDPTPQSEPRGSEQHVAALRDRLWQIQRRLQEVQGEIHTMVNTPEVALSLDVKLARQEGRDLLAELTAQAKLELASKEAELERLVNELTASGIVSW